MAFVRKALRIWCLLRQSTNSSVLAVQFGTKHGVMQFTKLEINILEFWDFKVPICIGEGGGVRGLRWGGGV